MLPPANLNGTQWAGDNSPAHSFDAGAHVSMAQRKGMGPISARGDIRTSVSLPGRIWTYPLCQQACSVHKLWPTTKPNGNSTSWPAKSRSGLPSGTSNGRWMDYRMVSPPLWAGLRPVPRRPTEGLLFRVLMVELRNALCRQAAGLLRSPELPNCRRTGNRKVGSLGNPMIGSSPGPACWNRERAFGRPAAGTLFAWQGPTCPCQKGRGWASSCTTTPWPTKWDTSGRTAKLMTLVMGQWSIGETRLSLGGGTRHGLPNQTLATHLQETLRPK